MNPTREETLHTLTKELAEAGVPLAAQDAAALLEHVTGFSKLDLILGADEPLTQAEVETLHTLVAQRKKRIPLAYLTGKANFWGYEFTVREGVLVPRPDSETLIAILETLVADKTQTFAVADIGVGSGCLLLTVLKEYPHAVGFGVDCEEIPLAVTQENAEKLGVTERCTLLRGHGAEGLPEQVDVLLSNPPYIAAEEWADLQPEVTEYEPKTALLAENNGLAVYQQLIPQAYEKLKSGGILLLEIGHTQADAVLALLQQQEHQWQGQQCFKDLSGKERVVFALKA